MGHYTVAGGLAELARVVDNARPRCARDAERGRRRAPRHVPLSGRRNLGHFFGARGLTSSFSRHDLANTIRVLAMDAVQQANSGHPGAPMGMADIAEVLWRDVLKHNPGNPRWADRDRFVLSNGHASMLLYAVLHLTGYPLSLDELRSFRQLGSRTPGHPEHDPGIGIETTTGPLGQGLANAVGLALAERHLAAAFNRPGFTVVDHHTYAFAGDGCLMEGVSHEACSLAGTLKLGKLIVFYDDNGISIDGAVQGWFADDTPKRFEAYGWQVIRRVDGHDAEAVARAIRSAQAEQERPTLICCQTVIGWGAPTKQGTKATHGEPLGAEEVAAARARLGWRWGPFEVPDALRAAWDRRTQGAALEQRWRELFAAYRTAHPELANEFERRMSGTLPPGWSAAAAAARTAAAGIGAAQATRQSSQAVLNAIGPALPELLGGSADLTGSNNTLRRDSRSISAADASGDYLHYGVREFAMTAIMNGLALHGGILPYGGTFLVFSDYARNAVRLGALMHQRVIHVYTHDSIGLGEDGPTHQPIEHLASLRAMPNLSLWRPCDALETAVAWQQAIERTSGPTALVLSRQALPQQPRSEAQLAAVSRGAYVLIDCAGAPEAIVIATGSEVAMAAEAVRALQAGGRHVRLVSMPSADVFEAQDAAWRESVLPARVGRRLALEAGASQSWWRYVGCEGRVLGIDRFGASGKAADLFRHFGLTADEVARQVRELLAG
ncbi:MAG: transketolase [Gammaproteobacteria bacterium]|nr:transketolase [Gammaproteobacteria bacterium]